MEEVYYAFILFIVYDLIKTLYFIRSRLNQLDTKLKSLNIKLYQIDGKVTTLYEDNEDQKKVFENMLDGSSEGEGEGEGESDSEYEDGSEEEDESQVEEERETIAEIIQNSDILLQA